MAAALAQPLDQLVQPRPRGLAPVALRVAGEGAAATIDGPTDLPRDVPLDLDVAWQDALAPHRVAARRDDQLAEVIHLDARRAVARRASRARGILFAAVLALVLALGAGILGADADGPADLGQTVTVLPGQTLWDVAAAHTPAGADVRATLDRIRGLNGLTGADVPAWTVVVLPAGLD